MLRVEKCMDREKEMVNSYLHISSRTKVQEKVRVTLLLQHEQQLLENEHSGLWAMLRSGRLDDLSRMKKLFSEIPEGLKPVAEIFGMHFREEGMAIVRDAEENPETFISKAIELNEKCLHYIRHCFTQHAAFHLPSREAFEVLCNKNISGNQTAELLAAFCDGLLKNGGLTIDDVNDTYEKVVRLLKYISNKDLFEVIYRKKLARRLLFEGENNVQAYVQTLIALLRRELGLPFTNKLEGMLKDATLWRETHALWEFYLNANPQSRPGIDLTVNILSNNYWPSYRASDLALPQEMAKCVASFTQFYDNGFQKRKLTWISSLGSCIIAGKFESKEIELLVAPYQAACLLLFNDAERLGYSDIKNQLNIPHEDVLHSLSCAKYEILKKHPTTMTIGREDTFQFNVNFTNRMRRIKVSLPPLEEKKVAEGLGIDRKFAIDACIVRIMKSRKTLGYQQLLSMCIEQLAQRFKPEPKAIKKQLEELIGREFLERDSKDPNTFHYLS